MSVPPPEINAEQLLNEREIANLQARHGGRAASLTSEMPCRIISPTKSAKLKPFPLSNVAGSDYTAETPQRQRLVSSMDDNVYAAPFCMSHEINTSDHAGIATNSIGAISSNSRVNAIINQGIHGLPDTLVSMCFEDKTAKKYKSLNRETMDDRPVYEDPTHTQSNGEIDEDYDTEDTYSRFNGNDRVKNAVKYARQHLLLNGVVSEGGVMRESVDGEYVLPNEVIQHVSILPTHEELGDGEQPDYICIS